jgi:hypothetical protein
VDPSLPVVEQVEVEEPPGRAVHGVDFDRDSETLARDIGCPRMKEATKHVVPAPVEHAPLLLPPGLDGLLHVADREHVRSPRAEEDIGITPANGKRGRRYALPAAGCIASGSVKGVVAVHDEQQQLPSSRVRADAPVGVL